MVHLEAVLVLRRDHRSTRRNVVVPQCVNCTRRAAAIGLHCLGQRCPLFGERADPRGGDLVAGERIANEAAARGVRARGGGIVNLQKLIALVHPFGKIAAVHFGRRDGKEAVIRSQAVAESFVREKEERLVASVVKLGNADGTAGSGAEIVLLVYGLAGREEPARVEFLVAQEVIGHPVIIVGPRLRRERHDPAAGLPVFGFESVGVHGELGNRLERRRIVGDFNRVRGPVRGDRYTIQRGLPRPGLSAAERKLVSGAARFGRDRHQVEGTPQRAADYEGQFVDELILHGGRDLGVLSLDLRRFGPHLDGFAYLAHFQPAIDAQRAGSGQHHVVTHRLLETGGRELEAVITGRKVGTVVVSGVGGRHRDALVRGKVRDRDCRSGHCRAG